MKLAEDRELKPGFSPDLSHWMTPTNSFHLWHFSFLCWKMSFGPNDTISKILKFWCPRFAVLQSFQTNPKFDSHSNWFSDALSKNILLNVWNSAGILFRASKSAAIVPWIGHANFHLCLGHFSFISASIYFPWLFILLSNFFHKATSDLDMLLILPCWYPKLEGVFENPQKLHMCSEKEKWGVSVNSSDK